MRRLSDRIRRFDFSKLFIGSTEKSESFRLLALPAEIRDLIYHAVLCDWGVQDPVRHGLTGTSDDLPLQAMAHKVEPNILLANKQVYQEAKEVFLKGNQFIHIRMTAREPNLIVGAFRQSRVPIVASGRDSVALFKDLVVMKHTIDFPGDHSSSQDFEIDVIILKRDLWSFAGGMFLIDVHSRRFFGHSKHNITIFNPFVKTLSPRYLNNKNVGRLLEPYVSKFCGFDDVNIEGHIDPRLAKSAVASINLDPPLPSPPNKIVDKLIALQRNGEQAFLEREFKLAIIYWHNADVMMMAMRNCKAWPRLMETAGRNFTDHLSDVFFQVETSRARVYLELAQEDPPAGGLTTPSLGWMSQIVGSCTEALEVGEILGTGWIPSDDQVATIYYYLAKAHRVMEEDVHFAEEEIRRADELRPDDVEIRAEMEKILEWKHNVGLP